MKVSFLSPLVNQESEVSEDLIAWLYFIVYPIISQTGSYILGEDIAKLTLSGKVDATSLAGEIYSAYAIHKIAQEKLGVLAGIMTTSNPELPISPEQLVSNYFKYKISNLSLEIHLREKILPLTELAMPCSDIDNNASACGQSFDGVSCG